MKQFIRSYQYTLCLLILSLCCVRCEVLAQTPFTSNEWSAYVDANPNGNFGNIPTAAGAVFSQWRRFICTHESAGDGYNSRGFNGNPAGMIRSYIKTDATTSVYIDSIRMNVRRSATGPASFVLAYMQFSSGIFTTVGNVSLNGSTNNFTITFPVNVCMPVNDSIELRILPAKTTNVAGTFRVRNGTAVYGRIYTNALPDVLVDVPAFVCSGQDAVINFTGTPNATVVYNTDGFTPLFISLNNLGNATLVLPAITAPLTLNVTNIFTLPCASKNLAISETILVNPAIPPTNLTATICPGETYTVGSQVYSATGLYSDTFTTATCDSIVNLDLTVNPLIVNNLTATICAGDTYVVGTQTYSATGLYNDTFTTAGCDSIVNLDLTVNPLLVNNLTATICAGETYAVGTQVYSTTGLYNDTFTTTGCDSIVHLDLTVNPLIVNNLNATICAGETYVVGTQAYSATGLYSDTFTTLGCDSIVNLNLTVNPLVIPLVTISANTGNTICAGTLVTFTAVPVNGGTAPVYQWKKNSVNVGTNNSVYTDNALINGDIITVELIANANCASTQPALGNSITMVVNAPVSFTETVSICDVQLPYLWNGATVNAGGSNAATATFNSSVGCDSVVTLNLTVSNSSSSSEQLTICASELPYLWYGNIVNSGGPAVASATFVNSVGCDSVVTLDLNVNPSVIPVVNITVSPGTNIPPGTPVVFTATIANGGTLPILQWQKNGINVGGNMSVYVDFNIDSGDVVTCNLQSNIPCAAPQNVVSNEIEIIVEAVPPPCYAPIALVATDIQMTSAIFKWTAVPSALGYEYALSTLPANPSTFDFTTDTFYHAQELQPGINYLHLRSRCANGDNSAWIRIAITLQDPTSIGNLNAGSGDLTLYPNPNNGNFNIKGNLNGKRASVAVLDNAGRIIYSGTIAVRNGEIDHYLQLAERLGQGVYLIRVVTEEEIKMIRFVHN